MVYHRNAYYIYKACHIYKLQVVAYEALVNPARTRSSQSHIFSSTCLLSKTPSDNEKISNNLTRRASMIITKVHNIAITIAATEVDEAGKRFQDYIISRAHRRSSSADVRLLYLSSNLVVSTGK